MRGGSLIWLAVRALMVAMLGLALGACAGDARPGDAAGTPAADAAGAAEYPTETAQFLALQRAGLAGDYPAFAGHLRADDPARVVAALGRTFGGQGFDVYTWRADASAAAAERLVELRGLSGRMYLYLRLDRVPGGWRVAAWDLDRDRAAIAAKL